MNDKLILTKKIEYAFTKEIEILLETTDNGKPPLSLQVNLLLSYNKLRTLSVCKLLLSFFEQIEISFEREEL